MADPVITNNDVGQIALGDHCDFEHNVVTFGGADVLAPGTIMARLATGKWGIYDDNGTPPLDVPQGVLTAEVTATGAGDVPVAVLVRGTVNEDRLIIDDGGTITAGILDELRSAGILAKPVSQLAQLDNQ